jgi:hypothetical protein
MIPALPEARRRVWHVICRGLVFKNPRYDSGEAPPHQ